jgi:hypothetical protein
LLERIDYEPLEVGCRVAPVPAAATGVLLRRRTRIAVVSAAEVVSAAHHDIATKGNLVAKKRITDGLKGFVFASNGASARVRDLGIDRAPGYSVLGSAADDLPVIGGIVAGSRQLQQPVAQGPRRARRSRGHQPRLPEVHGGLD